MSREMSALLLQEAGYEVVACPTAEDGMREFDSRPFGLLILDQNLPGISGLQMLSRVRMNHPDIPAIFIAGSLDLNLAVRISQERVSGIFTKPVDPRVLLRKVAEVLQLNSPAAERRAGEEVQNEIASGSPFLDPNLGNKVGRNTAATRRPLLPSITDACDAYNVLGLRLKKVADFRSTLLLQGPVGAPFSALARSLVAQSMFADGPFLECGAEQFSTDALLQLLASLLVSEHAGTLLLTGIEDFSEEQVALLDQLLRCRGPFMPFAQRFRIVVGATPRLAQLAEEGSFDENLYYRLSALMVMVPSLAEMQADLVPLARYFLEQEALNRVGAPTTISPEAAAWIEARDWPGECLELQTVVVKASRFQIGATLDVHALEVATGNRPAAAPIPQRRQTNDSPVIAPILVVDDSATPRETTALVLEEAGFEVVAHEAGAGALADVKARRFSLFILDYELPGMTGLELLEAARRFQPDVPAIFVAGSLNLQVAAEISRVGVSGIFTKPPDLRALVRKVTEIIQEGQAARGATTTPWSGTRPPALPPTVQTSTPLPHSTTPPVRPPTSSKPASSATTPPTPKSSASKPPTPTPATPAKKAGVEATKPATNAPIAPKATPSATRPATPVPSKPAASVTTPPTPKPAATHASPAPVSKSLTAPTRTTPPVAPAAPVATAAPIAVPVPPPPAPPPERAPAATVPPQSATAPATAPSVPIPPVPPARASGTTTPPIPPGATTAPFGTSRSRLRLKPETAPPFPLPPALPSLNPQFDPTPPPEPPTTKAPFPVKPTLGSRPAFPTATGNIPPPSHYAAFVALPPEKPAPVPPKAATRPPMPEPKEEVIQTPVAPVLPEPTPFPETATVIEPPAAVTPEPVVEELPAPPTKAVVTPEPASPETPDAAAEAAPEPAVAAPAAPAPLPAQPPHTPAFTAPAPAEGTTGVSVSTAPAEPIAPRSLPVASITSPAEPALPPVIVAQQPQPEQTPPPIPESAAAPLPAVLPVEPAPGVAAVTPPAPSIAALEQSVPPSAAKTDSVPPVPAPTPAAAPAAVSAPAPVAVTRPEPAAEMTPPPVAVASIEMSASVAPPVVERTAPTPPVVPVPPVLPVAPAPVPVVEPVAPAPAPLVAPPEPIAVAPLVPPVVTQAAAVELPPVAPATVAPEPIPVVAAPAAPVEETKPVPVAAAPVVPPPPPEPPPPVARPRPPTRPVVRKQPGSYDLNERLRATLGR